ncbi:metallophosphoesterase [Aeromonas diversa]|uniref:metallophosphoesterase n=1 Tax=Aeromonas diversa TaxID=502790 RepID=UPI003461C9CD
MTEPYHPHQVLKVSGRAWFMGDLHGCFSLLREKLADSGFNPGQGDMLIGVGDLIDRGPDSLACLSLLERPWFRTVLGNHEAMMLGALQGSEEEHLRWRRNGGEWFDRLSAEEQQSVRGVLPHLAALPLALTVETASGAHIGVVHADPGSNDWNNLDEAFCLQHRRTLLWERGRLMGWQLGGQHPGEVTGVDRVVMGHTPLRDEHWLRLGNLCWLDTGATYNGELTLVSDLTLLG